MAVAEVDDTVTELDAIREVVAQDEARRAKEAAKAPAGFDPAAVFLLYRQPMNLFEPTGTDYQLRCKGCGRTVVLWNHGAHFSKHKKQLTDGVIKDNSKPAKGDDVAKAGPKEQQLREQREARAERITTPITVEKSGDGYEVVNGTQRVKAAEQLGQESVQVVVEKSKRAPRAAAVAETGTRADSEKVAAEVVKRFVKQAKADKLGKVETKANEKVGYVSIKVDGTLVGYLWLTNKADLRVEAAISKSDMPDDDRVGPYKRSKTIQARTRIAGDDDGYTLACQMFTLAAGKVKAA